MLSLLSASCLKILINSLAPVAGHGSAGSHCADSIADYIVIKLCSLAVTMVVYCHCRRNAYVSRCLNCIDVCAQENEFPTVLFLLSFYHFLDTSCTVTMATILHTVRDDDENRMLWHIFWARILVNVADVMNGLADGIQQELFPDLSDEEQLIVETLRNKDRLQLNIISVSTGIPAGRLSGLLFTMEMKGVVRMIPGGMYRLN